ncbi:MAG TPA: DegT/DnrJ/EryC1/StrS family aminotransferase [Edaphocola sp.]|nr:DegT/DnrJ/EryC1/StrS family aminotransferase [Edaphocola sp.]
MSTNQYPHVPYGKTVHGQEEIDAVVEVLKTSTQMGKNVRALEDQISNLYAKKYGLGVNSGSSALYLAADLLNFEEGAELITPALTFSTTVAPLVKKNWIPAFVDVEEGTYNIDVNKVEEMITPKTKALWIPNLIGNLPDWKELRAIADKHNLFVLEDSADTLGAEIDGASSGRFTDISTTSFYGSHIVNCGGNGGMICMNDEAFYTRGKLLRSWGRSSSLFVESEAIENRFNVEVDGIPYDAKFVFEEPGFNIEPSEMGSAFGLVQVSKLADNIDKRSANYNEMRQFFEQYNEYFILPNQLANSRTGWLAFAVTIKDTAPFTRRDLQIFLEKRNIQTRTVFTGNILRQPGFKNIAHKANKNGYAKADEVMRGGMLIACHHGLDATQIAHMKDSVEVFMKEYKK